MAQWGHLAWHGLTLVQVMDWCLVAPKLFLEPMLIYRQWLNEVLCSIHLRENSQEMLKSSICKMILKFNITLWKLPPHFPRANESRSHHTCKMPRLKLHQFSLTEVRNLEGNRMSKKDNVIIYNIYEIISLAFCFYIYVSLHAILDFHFLLIISTYVNQIN